MRMKPALTLDDAKKLLAAAEDEAMRNKWEVVIAILNDGGRIVAVHRMDGARPGNDQIAIAKATTSAMTCRPSVVWEKWIEGPHKAYATFPFIAAQGGLPIIIDGDLIGAIGVSGVRSSEDEQIAMTAIKPVFPNARTVRAGEENDAQTFYWLAAEARNTVRGDRDGEDSFLGFYSPGHSDFHRCACAGFIPFSARQNNLWFSGRHLAR